MKLKLALQADIGDAIVTEGILGYIGKPKNIVGSKNGNDYNFWSQFVTIEEGDDKIGVSVAFNSEAECLQNKGERIKVKGTMGSYEKDGKTIMKIDRAKVVERFGSSSTIAAQSSRDFDRENHGKCFSLLIQAILTHNGDPTVSEVALNQVGKLATACMNSYDYRNAPKPAEVDPVNDFAPDDDIPF